jgi:hypothetical protein
VGYRDRRQFVKTGNWVLVSMRNYESENNFRERRGDILLKYTDKEVRQLSNAGELPSERISEQRASDSAVLFRGQR